VITAQQAEIRSLKAALQDLQRKAAAPEPVNAPLAPADSVASAELAAREKAEIARLQTLADKLTAEVSRLENIRSENEKLRRQLAASAASVLTPEETKGLEEARDRAMSINCVNNLKQLGLAVRTWALDNGDLAPANILQMTNEMSTPKI